MPTDLQISICWHEINRNVKEINPRFIDVSENPKNILLSPIMLPYNVSCNMLPFQVSEKTLPSQQHDCRSEHSHVTLPPREFRSRRPTRPACRAASNTAWHLGESYGGHQGPMWDAEEVYRQVIYRSIIVLYMFYICIYNLYHTYIYMF